MIRRHKTTIFTDAKESTTVYELKRIVEGILKRPPEDQRLYKVGGRFRGDLPAGKSPRLFPRLSGSDPAAAPPPPGRPAAERRTDVRKLRLHQPDGATSGPGHGGLGLPPGR